MSLTSNEIDYKICFFNNISIKIVDNSKLVFQVRNNEVLNVGCSEDHDNLPCACASL